MDLHNMDEFLNLQDQNTTNLLSTEQIEQPEHIEEEWHSATPLDDMLSPTNDNKVTTNWSLLQNGLNGLQGINLTEIIGQTSFTNDDATNCITPDFLIKQQPTSVQDEKRVTRSKTAGKITPETVKEEPKKKKTTRAKKVYCICKQPYNGKPMVQCDRCEEWFHCACVGFNPDIEEEEDIDWICKSCSEENNEQTQEKESEQQETPSEEQQSTATRQTRGSVRHQSTCLYEGCDNHTKADSFCSDVCARKHNEGNLPKRRASTRVSAMKPPSPTQKKEERRKSLEDSSSQQQEISQSPQPQREESGTPETSMSPSQMTEEENPVRRNVIKNMTAILKPIFDTALEKTPDVFEDSILTSQERAEQLAKSIESTMLEKLGDLKGRHRTCGESYKSKFRSLLYNLKDKANDVFQVRVVTGDLSPTDLVDMSSEDMANPKLKSMAEVLRQKSLKNSVLKLENTPIIKKTHKGDIIMIPNNDNDSMYSEQVQQELDKLEMKKQNPVSEEEKEKEVSSWSPTEAESKDPLDDILARISLPSTYDGDSNKKRSISIAEGDVDSEAKKRKLAEDVEKLLGGDDDDTNFEVDEVDITDIKESDSEEKEDSNNDQEMAENPPEEQVEEVLPSIWEGRVNMPQVAEFDAKARQIGGRVLSPAEWEDILSPTMWIEGRIPTDRVNNYITQTQYSQSREIVLLEIEATQGDADEQSQVLLEYFETRQRYAVVGHNKSRVKDFYLVPLYKSQNIPDCLYVVRVEETKRKCDMFLGVLVLSKQAPEKKKEPAPQQTYQTTEATSQYQTTYPTYQPPSSQVYQQPNQYSHQQPYQYGRAYNNNNYQQQQSYSNNNYQNLQYQQRNYSSYYNKNNSNNSY